MSTTRRNPRVLIVTPEVTYLPPGMGNIANHLAAKAGGLADVSAALISALFEQGADVHVALPDYRALFNDQLPPPLRQEWNTIRERVPDDRLHLAEDRAFYYRSQVYSSYGWKNMHISLAFQREVINHIIPEVQPDLIHCNDWMTGLIPAMARRHGIPCLFTIHNIHTVKTTMAHIEDRGIDTASFWQNLYFQQMSYSYEETREHNPVDFLTSGVFAAHFVNTVSPTFLHEIIDGRHNFVEPQLQHELSNKWYAGCAAGILNAPDPSYNPATDAELGFPFDTGSFTDGKRRNKRLLQKTVGLRQDENAPLFFWPSRLDPVQKGCQLLADILYETVSRYWQQNLQIIFVANGDFQQHFKDIVNFHKLHDRVAVCHFDEQLSRQAYGAADFILMPSRFEPCGLPQMIGPIYGTLPVAHNTGGIHDTVTQLDHRNNQGNGFLFDYYDAPGLFWACEQAMNFYNQPAAVKQTQIGRIMTESAATFNHSVTASHYINLYETMLERPLINPDFANQQQEVKD
ncbi:MAG: glycogen/starch synthase [Deltaproteobacteria bacterium]|nr:glycogen/starch synthase [Candidatus Anaeroferrophillus wilburensis]MBN2888501.1 glycogen/starch synthase [Deltaproteobacteria bacterium]